MIISFFGHSSFSKTDKYEKIMQELLEEKSRGAQVDFYLGNYGMFDSFAYGCAKKFKERHPDARLIFITPYINENNISNMRPLYDEIIYPALERVPPKFAIVERNRWTVRSSDLIIFFITHSFGGAYKAYLHAQKLCKAAVNLATLEKN